MRLPRRYLALVLLPFLSVSAWAQPQPPPDVRGPASGLATRSVSTYLALERELLDALSQRNRAAALRMISEDFAVSSATEMDEISAADWLKQELENPRTSAGVRNLNVREFGDIAIVNFLLDSKHVVNRRSVTSTHYVIDVWRRAPHQLLARYVSVPVGAPPIPTRPTGRE